MPHDGFGFLPRLNEVPLDDASGSGAKTLQRLLAKWRQNGSLGELAAGLDASPELKRFLCGVLAGSPFLGSLIERDPAFLQQIIAGAPETEFAEVISGVNNAVTDVRSIRDIMSALRRGRNQIALLTGLADLGGIWNVDQVTAHLSEAAQAFTSAAVRFLLLRADHAGTYKAANPAKPDEGSGLIVLAMGKFGARELNYSSDIDLIVFFDREAAPLAAGVEVQPFFVRLTRDLVHILQERTADGYVYRVDLRLRPDPGSTQAAISTEAAFAYYETLGQNWERAAFIKARPVAGDIAAGEAFLRGLEPYIWRKYLDYNAIADIHAMKRQIHAAKGHAQIAVAGHNLKLGRGGIREIEFFVQSQQLIAGGRQPALRTRRTLEVLDKLARLEWISSDTAKEMTSAYCYLRRMEHRLQMIADQQTHTLPSLPAELERFAGFAGYNQLSDFERELRAHMTTVQNHYAALFEEVPELTPARARGNLVFTGDDDDPSTLETLRALGFKNPSAAISTIKGWHFGRYRAMRSVRAREMLTEFTPALLEALAETADPDLALSTFDAFMSALPAALQLFSMLRANPDLLHLLARIMGSAPRLARILSRRHRLLDVILDPGFLSTTLSRDDMRDYLDREISEAGSYEQRLDRARVLGQEQAFYIGVGLLSRQLSPLQAGERYSLLAEALIAALLQAVQDEFGGDFPAPAVIAMGKLGGGEMTASSDLDIIVVYDAPGRANATQHYARLTQRLIAALSANTAEGQLYPVDMRLRPSGKAGPLAVSFESFASYQQSEAWTWEHMALTRARPVGGPQELRARLMGEIRAVLSLPRDAAKAAADVRQMRALIAKEKGTGDIWDTRNYNGGLVDVEFIAQFLQITHANTKPEILSQNTIQALHNLAGAKLIAPGDADELRRAAELYNGITQVLRLCADGRFQPEEAPRDLIELLLHVTGEPDMPRLEARLRATYSDTGDNGLYDLDCEKPLI